MRRLPFRPGVDLWCDAGRARAAVPVWRSLSPRGGAACHAASVRAAASKRGGGGLCLIGNVAARVGWPANAHKRSKRSQTLFGDGEPQGVPMALPCGPCSCR